MNRIILKTFISFSHSDVLTEAHHVMFHGEAFRGGKRAILTCNATFFNGVRSPLRLVHSKQLIPNIFKPAQNLVVSEIASKGLRGIQGVELLEVKFDKLVDFYYEKGNADYYYSKYSRNELGEPISSTAYIVSLPDDVGAHRFVRRYYEVIVPKDVELADHFDSIREVEIDVEPPEWHGRPVTIRYSREMLNQYPIIKAQHCVIFDPELFRQLEEFVDPDYFLIKEVDL